jgi:hypothetical protein
LFKADAFIFLDKLSSKVYDMYSSGTSEEEIKNKWENLTKEYEK